MLCYALPYTNISIEATNFPIFPCIEKRGKEGNNKNNNKTKTWL